MNHDKNKQNRKTGYMARAFLSGGTIAFMKWTEEQVDHMNATPTQANLTRM